MSRENEDRWIKKQQISVTKEKEEVRVKDLHWMHCPKCGHEMVTINNHDVMIDMCTKCEGLYFDKGEFEELLQMEIEDRSNFIRSFLQTFKR